MIRIIYFVLASLIACASLCQTNHATVELVTGTKVSGIIVGDLGFYRRIVIVDESGKKRKFNASEVSKVELGKSVFKSKTYRDSTYIFQILVQSKVSLLKLGDTDFFLEMDSIIHLPRPSTKTVNGVLYEDRPYLNHLSYLLSSSCIEGMIDQNLDYNDKDLKKLLISHLECNNINNVEYVSPHIHSSSSFALIGGGQVSSLGFSYKDDGARLNDFSRYTDKATFTFSPYLGFECLIRWDQRRIGILLATLVKYSSFQSEYGEDKFYNSSRYDITLLESQLRIGLLFSVREKLNMAVGLASTFKVYEQSSANASSDSEDVNLNSLFVEEYEVIEGSAAGPLARFQGYKEFSGQLWSPTAFYQLSYGISDRIGLQVMLSSNYGYHSVKVKEVYGSRSVEVVTLRSYRFEGGIGIIYKL